MYVKIDHLKDITGVIHCGGHRGEEQPLYDSMNIENVVWIEAIEDSYKIIEEKFKDRKNITVFNECLSNTEEDTTFNITNNLASSSLLELGTHKEKHPKVHVDKVINVKTIRLDTLINRGKINISKYNFINLDLQGAELKALEGLGIYLKYIKYVYCEVNKEALYKGCALIGDIDDFLKDFERVDTKMTKYNWGDSLYVRK